MKKILFALLAILATFMCSCEDNGPEYGYIDVYNESYCSYLFVDIIDANGNIYFQASVDYCEFFKVPVGEYTVSAVSFGYEKEKTCTVRSGKTTNVYFY